MSIRVIRRRDADHGPIKPRHTPSSSSRSLRILAYFYPSIVEDLWIDGLKAVASRAATAFNQSQAATGWRGDPQGVSSREKIHVIINVVHDIVHTSFFTKDLAQHRIDLLSNWEIGVGFRLPGCHAEWADHDKVKLCTAGEMTAGHKLKLAHGNWIVVGVIDDRIESDRAGNAKREGDAWPTSHHERRMDHSDDLIVEYNGASGVIVTAPSNFLKLILVQNVHREFGKDFNFLKTTLSQARTASFFIRHKISLRDENDEAMARIKMAVDEWEQSQENLKLTHLSCPLDTGISGPKRLSASRRGEKHGNPIFRNFNTWLREYIALHHPSHSVRLEQEIKIEACKAVYIDYQSKVDWRSAHDILRCNPNFHSTPRTNGELQGSS
ncbi:hypothetical protein DFH08DRAFT_806026 [Mycena albidolilacea]|uniref:Uncharacterized protein n=1 Tax=Mycena albidolilacea TaxID=1033008 RepID=A0AAD7A7M0_9AGAR|nr:hypothetical protein DFH08DRAFT_806026 [Mycena albidolilacea]